MKNDVYNINVWRIEETVNVSVIFFFLIWNTGQNINMQYFTTLQ
jgi:hypothetical protein